MSKLLRILLPILVVLAGLVVFGALVKTRPEPAKTTQAPPPPTVDVVTVQAAPHQVTVQGQGTVQPSRQVGLAAEVAARVVWVSPDLVPGGRVSAGQPLFRLERDRFEVAVARARSDLARARTELTLERGRVEVAEREWQLFERDAKAQDGALARREPQLRAAQANVAAAEANLREARLNLQRTEVRAPFSGVVQSEQVDLGQYVQPGQAVAQLAGDQQFWVQVTLPVDRLAWIELPDAGGEGGAQATVVQRAGGQVSRRAGRVVRLLGELDPQARQAQLLVAVDKPLEGEQPLLIGTFVDVDIAGRTLERTLAVPRMAVFDRDAVWTVDADQRLRQQRLDIVWRNADAVFVREGLGDSVRVAVSRIPNAVEGMAVAPRAAQGIAP